MNKIMLDLYVVSKHFSRPMFKTFNKPMFKTFNKVQYWNTILQGQYLNILLYLDHGVLNAMKGPIFRHDNMKSYGISQEVPDICCKKS